MTPVANFCLLRRELKVVLYKSKALDQSGVVQFKTLLTLEQNDVFLFLTQKKLNLQQIRDLYVCFVRARVCKLVCVCKREGGPYLSTCIGVQIVQVLCAKHCTKSSVYKHPLRLLI